MFRFWIFGCNKNKHAARPMSPGQQAVFSAIDSVCAPVTSGRIAVTMHRDNDSVTSRISELVKLGKIEVAYRKQGLDGNWRNFYVVTKR